MASQQGFAARISAAWRRSIEAVIETGKLLIEAKGKLGHGEFTKMIEKRLPFGAETAQRLMKIARDKRITNPAHGPHLPASWRSLHELTTLSDEEFAAALKDGRINSEMERKDAVAIRERAAGMTSLRIIRDDRPPTQIITQIENPPQPRVVVTQEELAPMARAANANLALERKRETWSRLVGLCAEINALGDLEFDALVEVLQPHEMRADVIQSARTRLTEAALAVERLEACREREWTGGGDRAGLH